MIFDECYMNFTDEQWIYIIAQYLNSWTEIPLNIDSGYDREKVKFYDGLIGRLLKDTEYYLKNHPNVLDQEFVNSWLYCGKIYRIIHQCYKKSNKTKSGYTCRLPKVEYHGMISHWTTDYTFKGMKHKIYHDEKFIILEANTKDHIAFNINKFRKTYGYRNYNTEREKEIIFPMYKDYTIEHRMTISEIIELKNSQKRKRRAGK